MIINYYDYCNNYCFRHDCYDYYYYYRHAYYDSYYICNTYTSVGSLHACRYLWAQWLRTYGCMLCSHPFVCPVAQIPPQLRSPRSCGPAVPRSHGPAVPRSCGPRSCSPSVLLPWLIARWLGVLSRPCSGPRSVVQGRGPTSSTWSGSAVCQTG